MLLIYYYHVCRYLAAKNSSRYSVIISKNKFMLGTECLVIDFFLMKNKSLIIDFFLMKNKICSCSTSTIKNNNLLIYDITKNVPAVGRNDARCCIGRWSHAGWITNDPAEGALNTACHSHAACFPIVRYKLRWCAKREQPETCGNENAQIHLLFYLYIFES